MPGAVEPSAVFARMNVANKLTLLRILLVPVFIGFMMFENHWGYLLGSLVFIAAAITDHYDGKLARERNLITDLGTFLDPLADKMLISAALIYFVGTKPSIPAWIVMLIIGREFAITGLRALAAAKGRIIAADPSGKLKTIVQLTVVITLLVLMTGRKFLHAFTTVWREQYDYWLQIGSYALMTAALIITLYSGYQYLRKNPDLLLDGLASPVN